MPPIMATPPCAGNAARPLRSWRDDARGLLCALDGELAPLGADPLGEHERSLGEATRLLPGLDRLRHALGLELADLGEHGLERGHLTRHELLPIGPVAVAVLLRLRMVRLICHGRLSSRVTTNLRPVRKAVKRKYCGAASAAAFLHVLLQLL